MKVPAKATLDVKCEIEGPLKVRIIDASLNARGFERKLRQYLIASIRTRGVTLESVKSPQQPAEFFAALAQPGDFNCLLLIAHGQVETEAHGCLARLRRWWYGRKVLKVRISGLLCPWLLLGEANADLTDKMVFLAVCGGHCPDSIWTWVTEKHLALVLVASARSVERKEVEAVFPPVLGDLNRLATFTPEDVDLAVKRHNAADAFVVTSAVGIHHKQPVDQ
ncbi:hypothetical protein WME99_00550 [Sorangium sp. So ce136]|uniref:hypothetical protein n=1 Tax=Sorangium sp. So ce136 TaxID=3133284 RepID=UPI003F061A98